MFQILGESRSSRQTFCFAELMYDKGFLLKSSWPYRLLSELEHSARMFARKEVALRVAVDLLATYGSMVLAFICWFFISAIVDTKPPAELVQPFKKFVTSYAWFLCLLAIVIFQLHGFYTRTRGYAGRYKMLVIVHAVTLFVVIYAFANEILYRGEVCPRGVALLAWVFLVATVGGSRWVRSWLFQLYQVEPRPSRSKPQRVLVLGGAGYLGSDLVPMLLDRGYRVRVLDSLLFGKESLRAVENHPHFELIPGDIRDIRVVVETMKGCDAVIDLAAIVGDPACKEHPQLATEVNRAATRMLIDVGRGYGIQRFLLASTCSVYGASEFLMDERAQVAPISLYASTKVDSEDLLLEATGDDFHPTILRLATLFGASPRPRFDLVVNLLTARAVCSGKITVYNGEQWRPFMHVHDAASAFLSCLENNVEVVSGEIFNAGSYELNCRLSELASKISTIIPKVTVECVENEDRRNYRVSFDKIHTRLGFVCERTLEQGIREMADMVRRSECKDFSGEMFNNQAMVRIYAQSPAAIRSSIRVLEGLAKAR